MALDTGWEDAVNREGWLSSVGVMRMDMLVALEGECSCADMVAVTMRRSV